METFWFGYMKQKVIERTIDMQVTQPFRLRLVWEVEHGRATVCLIKRREYWTERDFRLPGFRPLH